VALVAQDGSNGADNQNFKLVPLDLAGLVARSGTARSGRPVDHVERDAPSMLAWATASVAAPEREDAAAVAANRFAYVIGGKPASGVAQATVHFAALNADGSTGAWAATTPLPAPREDHNAVVAGGRLYVIGGGGPNATVYSAAINPNGTLGAGARRRRCQWRWTIRPA